MSEPNLQEIHDYLISLAKKAGEKVLAARPKSGAIGSKINSVDLVTETDRAVENLISTSLREKYPDYSFMGEETYKPGDKLTDAPTFIVDPIDGTTNFVHSHPYVSISLGFAIARRPVVGVVYNPFTHRLYSGVKGQGSYLTTFIPTSSASSNDANLTLETMQKASAALSSGQEPTSLDSGTYLIQRLPLRAPEPLTSLQTCLIAVEYGSDRRANDFLVKTRTFTKLTQSTEEGGAMVHSLRSLGSAALNICGVAEGGLDIYWEAGCWAWDVCAGWCVLSEAGGRMVDANPGNWEPAVDGRRYMAVRAGEGQVGIIGEFWSKVQGKFEISA